MTFKKKGAFRSLLVTQLVSYFLISIFNIPDIFNIGIKWCNTTRQAQ
jgi:hypothetical protein